jgi:CheY-like chemotaxis protein
LADDSPDSQNLLCRSFKHHADNQVVSGQEVFRDLKAVPELSPIPVAFLTARDRSEEQRELARWVPADP